MAYATDYANENIIQMDNDGSNAVVIVSGSLGNPIFIEYSPELGKIYWAADGSIHRASADGSNVEAHTVSGTVGNSYVTTIAIDGPNNKIYYSRPAVGTQELYSSDVDGSNEVLIESGVKVQVLAIDQPNQHLYYFEDYKHLTRIDTDGGNKTLLLTDAAVYTEDIELDLINNKVYWSDSNDSKIYRSDMDGSDKETIITSATAWLLGINVVPGSNKLYWTEWNPHLYRRSDLDGSSEETLATLDDYWYDTIQSNTFQASGNLFISGPSAPESSSGTPLRIINHFTKMADYDPQLIGSFDNGASSVNIQIWDIVDGINIPVVISNSGCYEIGDTNKWGWSTEYLPFASGYHNYHYYFKMITDTGGTDYGEFFLTVPERGRWVYP